jgi:DNA-binding helix-hairpin-helix protein with protein kinase domain
MPYTSIRGQLLKDGGEGYIYEVRRHPELLMKIYKRRNADGAPIVTPELVSKREYMSRYPPGALVSRGVLAWPNELVYENGSCVGYIMQRLRPDVQTRTAYSRKRPTDAAESVSSRVGVAVNLSAALHERHGAGYVVGDFNRGRVGMDYSTGLVYFADCDSFQITDDGADTASLTAFTRESDLFCLAIHIFRLLMNEAGERPFALYRPPVRQLPPELLALFRRAFIDGRAAPSARPDAQAWHNALKRYAAE